MAGKGKLVFVKNDAIGEMRDRVTIQQRVSPARRDEVKQEIVEWESIDDPATVWANVASLDGREFWQSQQAQSQVTHTVTIRYREGLTAQHRLLWGARYLNIDSIVDPDGFKRFLKIRCVERFDAQPERGY